MKVMEFLNSGLLPRTESSPDIFSHERYWGLTTSLHLYSYGFNCTTYDKQSKPIIQNIQDMNPEKWDLLNKFKDYEVKQVAVGAYTGTDDKYAIATYIQIEISDEELRKMGLLK